MSNSGVLKHMDQADLLNSLKLINNNIGIHRLQKQLSKAKKDVAFYKEALKTMERSKKRDAIKDKINTALLEVAKLKSKIHAMEQHGMQYREESEINSIFQ